MEYRKLGQTGLDVSMVCLGTMTWGEQNTQSDGFEQLDYAIDNGINFVDTAEMYAIPPTEKTYGTSETIVGNWLVKKKIRDKIILATKAASRAEWLPHIRDGKLKLNREHLIQAVDDSLKRLKTDYIDLYQLHWPERATNFFGQLGYKVAQDEGERTSIHETLEVLGQLVKAGKIRYIGLSNETPWGAMRFLYEAHKHDLPRIVSVQNPYNLLNRSYEIGLAEISHREQLSLLAYSPLGFGVLSGKYLNGANPEGARISLFPHYGRYTNDRARAATRAYVEIAKNHELDPAQMALAYLYTKPFLTSVLVGATTMGQLKINIASRNLSLSKDVLKEIEAVHKNNPNPSP